MGREEGNKKVVIDDFLDHPLKGCKQKEFPRKGNGEGRPGERRGIASFRDGAKDGRKRGKGNCLSCSRGGHRKRHWGYPWKRRQKSSELRGD